MTFRSAATRSASLSPRFKVLRWRLLLSSLGIIGMTLAMAGAAVYEFVAYSLIQKADNQLGVLADAAVHSLIDIENTPSLLSAQSPRPIDNDGDLDLPWQDLRQSQQSIEWFNVHKQLIGKSGADFPNLPLLDRTGTLYTLHRGKNWHMLTVPVYRAEKPQTPEFLQGYVRVSEPIAAIDEELHRLRWGLQWGGGVALLVSGMGSWWLMRQSLQPVEQSFQQLKQFTADASHELRNPLTAIRASVEVMQSHRERVHPSDQNKLDAIASATAQMSHLIEDLLWLARNEGSLASLTPKTAIPLDELLEDLLDLYIPQAEQRQITLKFDLTANALVAGDAHELKRLFANLLTNALKYTPVHGAVTLTSMTKQDDVIVSVQDTGIGIAPEQLSFVFDRFWRADQARSYHNEGAGLGLSIAQTIAQKHAGTITVQSRLGQGTCFQVRLPKK